MPETTLRDIPYPDGSDPVTDGNEAIGVVAQALDEAVQASLWTTGAFAGTGAGNIKTQAVVFAEAYAAVPAVMVTAEATPANVVAYPSNITVSGFTLNAYRLVGTATFDVHWTAVSRTQ